MRPGRGQGTRSGRLGNSETKKHANTGSPRPNWPAENINEVIDFNADISWVDYVLKFNGFSLYNNIGVVGSNEKCDVITHKNSNRAITIGGYLTTEEREIAKKYETKFESLRKLDLANRTEVVLSFFGPNAKLSQKGSK